MEYTRIHGTASGLTRQDSLPSEPTAETKLPLASIDDANLMAFKASLEHRLNANNQHAGTSSFEKALHQDLHRIWLYDRTVNLDWNKNHPYAEKRRAELATIPGAEEIAGQYGITLAVDGQPPNDYLHRLRFRNNTDSDYIRTNPSAEYFQQYQKIYGKDDRDKQRIFVNSSYAADKILSHLHQSGSAKKLTRDRLPSLVQPMATGIYEFKLPKNIMLNADKAIKDAMRVYGAYPSAYALMASVNGPKRDIVENSSINNEARLEALKGKPDDSVSDRLRLIPYDHGTAMLARSAASLIDHLVEALEQRGINDRLRHNPILNNGLNALHRIADSLPSLSHDSLRFANGYQALMEELQVCLSAATPYNIDDFRAIAEPMLEARHLPSSVLRPEVKLVSSGMTAIALGFDLAEMLTGTPKIELASTKVGTKTPVYFEIELFHKDRLAGTDKNASALYATVYNGTPDEKDVNKTGWGIDSVIVAVDTRLKKAKKKKEGAIVLVLDSTLERRGDMDKLISRFANDIGTNRLRVVVCKSYQKYSNLCSGKVMAGSVSIISADDPAARKAKTYLDQKEQEMSLMGHNDAQLLTHFLKNREHEFNLLDRALDNTRFVAQTFFHGKDGHSRFDRIDKNMPFAVLAKGKSPHTTTLRLDGKELTVPVQAVNHHINSPQVRERSGFAYASTTMGDILLDNKTIATRIAFGQESQAELTEIFFMPSRLTHNSGSKWGCQEAYNLIQNLVSQALKESPASHLTGNLAQKLTLISHQEQPEIDSDTRLESSPATLRQQYQHNNSGGLTMSKIASVVNYIGNVILKSSQQDQWASGPDRELIDELLNGLIHSGLPGISASGRTGILELQAFMCMADMKSQDCNQQKGLSTLVDTLTRIPLRSRMEDYLKQIPDSTFTAANPTEQDRVINTLFLPLDSQSRISVIDYMIKARSLNMATACLNAFEASLDRQPPVSAETFHSSEQLIASDTIRRASPEEIGALQGGLLTRKSILDTIARLQRKP